MQNSTILHGVSMGGRKTMSSELKNPLMELDISMNVFK